MHAAVDLRLQLAGRDRDAQVAEIVRSVGLDLVPGQDQPLPASLDVGHDLRITESFGDAEPRVECWRCGQVLRRRREHDHQTEHDCHARTVHELAFRNGQWLAGVMPIQAVTLLDRAALG